MKRLFIFVGLVVAMAATAQTQDDKVIMTIDGQPVYQSEFDYIYGKNNTPEVVDKKSPEEYMDLFLNFRLKVKEAEDQGLDTLSSFKHELRGYCIQLARPQMTDTVKRDELLHEAYDRKLRDVKVAHIAVKCPANVTDTAAAYAKIQEAWKRATGYKVGKKLIKPENFAVLADSISEDPSVRENHGTLDWMNVFCMVYPFENAAYQTPVGKVSGIFRSPYGYHILKVLDERPSQGEYHAAHIMLFNQDGDSLVVKQRIDSLDQLLKQGAAFEDLARANSQDRGSSMRGGDLGWISTGRFLPECMEVFSTMQAGAVSAPVKSQYGWHLLKLIEKRPWGTFEEQKPELERMMARDSRSELIDKSFVQQLKEKYGADLTREQLEDAWMADRAKTDTAFANLIREYHDGILLFDISNREVWEKAAKDEPGLEKYFQEHRDQYTWDSLHYGGYVVYCRDLATQKVVYQIAKHMAADSLTGVLNRRLNDSIQYVKVQHLLFQQGDSSLVGSRLVQNVLFQQGNKTKAKSVLLKNMNTDAGAYSQTDYPYVVLVGDVMAAPKSYKDVRGQVTSDYQDYLENLWIQELKKKHTVVVMK